jgi:hypothetical protein
MKSSYGDLSAVLLQNSPFWVTLDSYRPNSVLLMMDEWKARLRCLQLQRSNENGNSPFQVSLHGPLYYLKRNTGNNRLVVIADIWPSLQLYIHGGVSFTPYRDQFQKLIGKKINYLEMYNASEGFFAAQ